MVMELLVVIGLTVVKRMKEVKVDKKQEQGLLLLVVRLVKDFSGTTGWPASLQWSLVDAFHKSATLGYVEDAELVKAIIIEVMPSQVESLPPITLSKSGRKSGVELIQQRLCLRTLKELSSREFVKCALCQSQCSVGAGESETCPVCQSTTVTGSQSQDD
jgi:hypothetical protein